MAGSAGPKKSVAVIGAGCSGLTAIKCCLDEGLNPVCLERTDQVGGLWRFSQKVQDGQACVMKSTVINTSKEMMCFSDYPIPDTYPNFMHNTLVWEYFKDYAKNFQLTKYIRHNIEVEKVSKAADFDTTGQWTLEMVDHQTSERTRETFDAVLVCTGHHADKNEPTFPGLESFKGEVIHSHDYREPTSYVGKRVVIIGIGNSGGDMAVELSRFGQVYLSTRRGTWILNRIGPNGVPFDIALSRRVVHHIRQVMPLPMLNWLSSRHINSRLDHDLYGLTPAYPVWSQHPMVNDDLGNRIACGSVKVKDDVKRFTATGVEFVDGSVEDDIDVVVLATGYRFGFPFMEKSVVDVRENRLPLFKYMFNPDLPHQTVAFIGCIQPLGAIMPISELQCRLAARVFKGDVKLPSSHAMWEDIQAKEAAMAKQYTKSPRHTIQVDYVQFMDELAELNGCRPDFVSLLKTDPRLALHVMFGPCTPYQYRLTGPGAWPGAREAILTTMDRVRRPLATRPLPASAGQSHVFFLWALALLLVVLLIRAIFL